LCNQEVVKNNQDLWESDQTLLRKLDVHQASMGLAGIDEAGRGALAGPVFAAIIWFSARLYKSDKLDARLQSIADSKKLSAAVRELAAGQLQALVSEGSCAFAVGTASVAEINERNILGATRLAMQRALQTLENTTACRFCQLNDALPLWQTTTAVASAQQSTVKLLIDGLPLRPFAWEHQAIVGGDARSLAIAAASILAKVFRDRHMRELAKRYPQYGFDRHAGYGTAAHRESIRQHGPCVEHRALFVRKVLGQ
jgi:ribonuclease HII